MDTVLAIVIATTIAAGYLAAIIYAVIQVTRTKSLSELEKIVWVVALIWAPAVGALVWYFAGPHPAGIRLTRSSH